MQIYSANIFKNITRTMSSVDTSPVNLVKTDNQRLSVRAEIFVTKGWQAMITYEEALKKARVCWDEVNYCTDQTDAFVFSKKTIYRLAETALSQS